MAGIIPECKEGDRAKVLAKMEETFVENLKFAAERLKQVRLHIFRGQKQKLIHHFLQILFL